jgi:glycosidase
VYLPSFQDSDGDGWGDLDGLRARLDHLADLGVDLIWVTPFFVSPMRDHGYDIADYLRVDPRFGGDEALDRLVAAVHRRGLRVIGDLVVNHTSDRHSWFQTALADPSGPYRGYVCSHDANGTVAIGEAPIPAPPCATRVRAPKPTPPSPWWLPEKATWTAPSMPGRRRSPFPGSPCRRCSW